MANNHLPLIPQPSDRKDAVKRRGFRRVKSAPLTECIPGEIDGSVADTRGSESMFGSLHPSLIQVAVYLFIYLGLGVICFYLVRHHISGRKTNDIVDALYLCIVTMTTVGYGYLVPICSLGKAPCLCFCLLRNGFG